MLEVTVTFKVKDDEYWTVRKEIEEILDRPVRVNSREV